MIQQRKKSNSSKVNLIISAIFHGLLVMAIFYFAAKEGLLGKKLKELTVTMEKVKKPEPPKEKPEPPKVEPPKQEQAKATTVPQPRVEAPITPPPAASDAAPTVAPAAVLPAFSFDEGAHNNVQSLSSPGDIYKALVERTLRSHWNRPEDMADDNFVAEVELTIDKSGYVEDSRWLKGSGSTRWDGTVKEALAQVRTISRPPPKEFPGKFVVRFDVESTRTEAIQFGSQ